MHTTERQHLETLEGLGTLSQDGTELARVSYHLEVHQDILVTRTNMGVDRLPGKVGISGSISHRSGDLGLPPPDQLTLHAADGRQLAVFFGSGDPLSGHYMVTAMFIETASSLS